MKPLSVEDGTLNGKTIFQLLAERYKDSADDYTLSIGHHAMPEPAQPLGIYNLPEFCGYMSITMEQIRKWAAGLDWQSSDEPEAIS